MAELSDIACPLAHDGDFVSVPLAAFRMPNLDGFDVFCIQEGRDDPALLSSGEFGLTPQHLDDLAARGYKSLLVRRSDFCSASMALFESLESIIADQQIPVGQRFALLQTAVAVEIESAFRHTDSGRFVDLANQIGVQIAGLFDNETIAPTELYGLAKHDPATFVHATNVAAYSVVLARELWSDVPSTDVQQIAVGALLHDLGKKYVPRELLNKRACLTLAEQDVVERHPQLGYETLRRRNTHSHGQLMMVYQHHEWLDGSGYPARVVADEIHPWAKLLAVVDVFDAITGPRPYRQRATASDALLYLANSAETHFDPEAVECWISIFHQR